jgi:pyruvate formate lyase activating enzyme
MRPEPEFMWTKTRCQGCKICSETCPENALTLTDQLTINETLCTRCGYCIEACYPGALELVGQNVSVSEVMEEILKDKVFHEESGGGATFSGGEPLSQPGFLMELLQECRRHGVHTSVDTCGYASSSIVESLKPLVDLWLYDLKHMDPEKHKSIIGVSNHEILENLKQLQGQNVIIRIPLIPGFNDNDNNIRATGRYLQEYGFTHVTILPYHTAGTEKRQQLTRQHPPYDNKPPEPQTILYVKRTLEQYNIQVKE